MVRFLPDGTFQYLDEYGRPITEPEPIEMRPEPIPQWLMDRPFQGAADYVANSSVIAQMTMVVSAQARARRDAPMVGGGSQGAGLGHLGADWYFQHHAKLAAVAEATGHTRQQVIAASAVMSPQNNPDQEYAAVHALAHGADVHVCRRVRHRWPRHPHRDRGVQESRGRHRRHRQHAVDSRQRDPWSPTRASSGQGIDRVIVVRSSGGQERRGRGRRRRGRQG